MSQPRLFEALEHLKAPPVDAMYRQCQAGHAEHQTTILKRSFVGQPKNASAPAIPKHIGIKEVFYVVYDWREYFMTVEGNETVPEFNGYCTGQDIISYCIDQQGVWEGDETLLILDLLSEYKSGVVLDFGAHIGYYSILAAKKGYDVASVDASAENLSLLERTAKMNGVQDKIHRYLGWLDGDVPMLLPDAESVQLLKADVEGAELLVVDRCANLFQAGKIKYAIIEISPTFNPEYPALVNRIIGWGYDVFQLPGNNWEHNEEFSAGPLKTIRRLCEVKQRGQELADHINSFSQENFLFMRKPNG